MFRIPMACLILTIALTVPAQAMMTVTLPYFGFPKEQVDGTTRGPFVPGEPVVTSE